MMIGVVIPVFNRSLRLQRAIRSVLGQTYRNFELVVVDDASTIDLASARKLVETSGHRWLSFEKNSGPAAARNAGVGALSQSVKWIAFLDSDDEWLPDKLERQGAWLREHPESKIFQCQETWIRNGSPARRPKRLLEPEGDIFADCVERCCISPSSVVMERDLFDSVGGFDIRYRVCEDYQLWLRIARQHSVGLLRDPLVIKNGGDADQLTATVQAFDRWRLLALLELLPDANTHRKMVLRGISDKARILERGAHRHADAAVATRYAIIAEWADASDADETLTSRHRDFVENLIE